MKVCGFSFLRNAVKFDYPFVEAITSILPLCDEVIVAVGQSDDDTLERVRAIDPKVIALETKWDESLKQGGTVFAAETNKAFQAIPAHYDWAFYIQGDEVVHEQYLPAIREAMERHLRDKNVEGLLFNYKHFFGSYDYVGAKYSWYRREIRIVRNRKDIHSFRDAQGFRVNDNRKLNVKAVDAWIYHYGWVREPSALHQKIQSNVRLYRGDEVHDEPVVTNEKYEYEQATEPVVRFTGTHPGVMKERILRKNWAYTPNPDLKFASAKDRFKRLIAKWTGWYPGEYKNYKLLR